MSDQRTRIDDAIDRAVRDMMRHDPAAGFRGRVLSRLDAPARRTLLWPGLAAAAGTVAVVALAVLFLRTPPAAPPSQAPVAGSQPAPASPAARDVPPQPASGPPAPDRTTRPARGPEPVRTATFRPRDGRIAAASLTPPPAAPAEPVSVPVPADDETTPSSPPPIVVRALTPPGPIEIAPIVVPPIQIPRMQNAPVPPPR